MTSLSTIARSEPSGLRGPGPPPGIGFSSESGLPVAQLRGLYRSAAERELREQIIWLMSESEDDSAAALDALIEIVRTDPDPEMRSKALFWIGESDDPRAEELLLEILGQGGRR